MPNFIAFISYVFVTSFTPGPNNIMAMTNASHHGFRKSIPFNLGVGVGFFTILILSNLFSVTLYRYLPTVKPVVLVFFSLFLAGVSFLSTGSWALFGSLFQRFMKKHYKVFNTVMALLLVYCAVSLFT